MLGYNGELPAQVKVTRQSRRISLCLSKNPLFKTFSLIFFSLIFSGDSSCGVNKSPKLSGRRKILKVKKEKKMEVQNEVKNEAKDEVKNEVEPDKNGNDKPEAEPVGHGMAQGHFSSEIFKIEIANIPKVVGYSECKKYLAKQKIKETGLSLLALLVSDRYICMVTERHRANEERKSHGA